MECDSNLVDGFRGEFELDPDAAAAGRYRARRERVDTGTQALQALRDLPAMTPDAFKVDLAANIELPAAVATMAGIPAHSAASTAGKGLSWPSEPFEQVLAPLRGEVAIRSTDASGQLSSRAS